MKKKREIEKELTEEELDQGVREFIELRRQGKVPKFIMEEVDRQVNLIFGLEIFPIKPVRPEEIQ